MTAQFARAPHQGRPAEPAHAAPNAALLIDFDNVTMGIRSDLSKELKKLLNTEVIKGKVAVQRAYADWRRYPQYIVPLSEASVDLIFAPAYGSSKKNATDIRLAIDALELVFTRPEIGTYILLSGDSDFSSLVLKLKEYGKYVIGVGMRESSSDLLVQNCDEYFSYSALAGLTRAGEEEGMAEDPFVLVERALEKMVARRDVMRSDRLKQVLLELDPNFDEKELGFRKFSKFLADAADRGVLRLRKLENGQYELEPGSTDGAAAETAAVAEAAAGAEAAAPPEPRRPRRGSRRDSERAEPVPQPAAGSAAGLQSAHELLRRAVSDLTRDTGEPPRDSDVKRRMLELESGWSEVDIGFSKFSRFLRQAHDAEIIDLRKSDNGIYEVLLPGSKVVPPGEDEAPRRGRGRGRGRDGRAERREREAEPEAEAPAAEEPEAEIAEPEPAAAARETGATAPEREPEERAVAETGPPAPHAAAEPEREREPKPREAAAAGAPAPAPEPRAQPRGLRFRRGTRGRGAAPQAPPALLEGQAVPGAARSAEPRAPAPAAEPAAGEEATGGAIDAAALGLPTERGAVVRYIMNSYKGVGQKTAETLVDAFGADRVFAALEERPQEVESVLGARRAEKVLDSWRVDRNRRSGDLQAAVAAGSDAGSDEAEPSGEAKSRRGRGRRGGRRGGGRKRKVNATAGNMTEGPEA